MDITEKIHWDTGRKEGMIMRLFHRHHAAAERHTVFYELWDAMKLEECPICHLEEKESERYLHTLLDESVTDGATQERLAKSHGFGPRATALLQRMHNNRGLGILYRRVCFEMLNQLKHRKFRPPEAVCPYEEFRAEVGARYAQEFATHAGEEDFQEHYEKSPGLCWRHVRSVAEKIHDSAVRGKLIAMECGKLDHLREDLDALIKEHDYRNTRPIGNVSNACHQAGVKTSDSAVMRC